MATMQSTRSASTSARRISPPTRARGERAIGEHEACNAAWGEVVDHVLHPGEVSVADGRGAVAPAHVVSQALSAPVAHIERRVGEDNVCLEVLVDVVVEGVGVLGAKITIYAPDGEVHLAQTPGSRVRLL